MSDRNNPCWCGSGKKYKRCHMAEDEQNKNSQSKMTNAKPLPKPNKNHIKKPEQIAMMRKCGAFNGEVLDYIRAFVKAGVTTEELNNLVHEYTVRGGYKPACLGYRGFKKSCCISRNDIVCHGIPSPHETIVEGDIVNIDLTSSLSGYHGDSSETFLIGNVSADARHIAEVAAQSLILGLDAVKPWRPFRAIGEAIEPFVKSQGCSVVRAYTGHGIGARFHEFFSVYHHIERGGDSEIIMCPGMTFTIEPMINLGGFEVDTDEQDGWTVRTKDGSLSAQYEHTVLVTESGVEILTLTPTQKREGVRLIACGKNYK